MNTKVKWWSLKVVESITDIHSHVRHESFLNIRREHSKISRTQLAHSQTHFHILMLTSIRWVGTSAQNPNMHVNGVQLIMTEKMSFGSSPEQRAAGFQTLEKGCVVSTRYPFYLVRTICVVALSLLQVLVFSICARGIRFRICIVIFVCASDGSTSTRGDFRPFSGSVSAPSPIFIIGFEFGRKQQSTMMVKLHVYLNEYTFNYNDSLYVSVCLK